MSAVGVRINQFNIPVCNSFQDRILNDQLCYEVDLNRFSNKNNIKNELKLGFNFILDYNEDRQVTFNKQSNDKMDRDTSMAVKVVKSDDNQYASIYLNTVGKDYTNNESK